MLYEAYQAQADWLAPFRAAADVASVVWRDTCVGPTGNLWFRSASAAAEIFAKTKLIHTRPSFDIDNIMMAGKEVGVQEEAAFTTPFGTLLHFKKDAQPDQPRVLLVAPMAGHFPTLLRNTVRTLLPEHDVYVTDWTNAREIPTSAGRFGMDDYIDHTMEFLKQLGPGAHAIGVCQPCAALLATVALMSEDDNPYLPRSLTLMAGPIDTRINPTKVNELATSNPIEWFERNLIATVPLRYAGAHRRVYPGFLQLAAFMSMNLPRHLRAHLDLFNYLVKGDDAKAKASREFYDEYFSVFDLPAEFYLETVSRVFQEHLLPKGELIYRGRRVDTDAIRKVSLLTVEGERDDICSVGQTQAAHDLCSGIKPFRKKHYVQPGVGHYGVFSGTRWQTQAYPIVRNIILQSE